MLRCNSNAFVQRVFATNWRPTVCRFNVQYATQFNVVPNLNFDFHFIINLNLEKLFETLVVVLKLRFCVIMYLK